MSAEENKIDFETSLKQLEEIVSKMEQGSLSLEQSLIAFEEGVKITKDCQQTLKKAEQRVAKLVEDGKGSAQLEDVDDLDH